MTLAVRGAIQVSANESDMIKSSGLRLLEAVLSKNSVARDEIISIVFSLTVDLTRANPATAVRANGYHDAPLFCVQEAVVDGQIGRIIRLLLTYRSKSGRTPVPVYLEGAQMLRPDLNDSLSS
jgi:chorismate mutase